jgi:hypothetical protein
VADHQTTTEIKEPIGVTDQQQRASEPQWVGLTKHEVAVSTVAVINAALDGFNHGDQEALSARTYGDPAAGPGTRRPQRRLGCSPCRTCIAGRPMPLAAGESELSLTAIRELGRGRAVCNLARADGTRLVGLYAVDDGHITAACHYFSDIEMLDKLGILPVPEPPTESPERDRATGRRVTTAAPPASPSLADSLHESRLAHRRERIRLVIHALDQRVHALIDSRQTVPDALTAAIRGFQKELEQLRPGGSTTRPRPTRQPPPPRRPDRARYREHTLRLDEVYPATTLVGRCFSCGQLLFDREPHEWATRTTRELCWPYNPDAALFCGRCSNDEPDTTAKP